MAPHKYKCIHNILEFTNSILKLSESLEISKYLHLKGHKTETFQAGRH